MEAAMHPNMSLLMTLDLKNIDACSNLFATGFIWHYYNPALPELAGDHRGVEGFKSFFAKLDEKSNSSFQVDVIDSRSVGDELVVTQVCNNMIFEENTIEFDAVVVWRIVNSKLTEAWDIPAINTIRILNTAN